MFFAAIVSHQIPHEGMASARPDAFAFALIVANFVSEPGIAEGGQGVCGNELAFAGCESFGIASEAIVPLAGRAGCLIDASAEHALHVCAGSGQGLAQVDFLALLVGQSSQGLVVADIDSCNPGGFPISRTD